jgi:hypothetical protein
MGDVGVGGFAGGASPRLVSSTAAHAGRQLTSLERLSERWFAQARGERCFCEPDRKQLCSRVSVRRLSAVRNWISMSLYRVEVSLTYLMEVA